MNNTKKKLNNISKYEYCAGNKGGKQLTLKVR